MMKRILKEFKPDTDFIAGIRVVDQLARRQ